MMEEVKVGDILFDEEKQEEFRVTAIKMEYYLDEDRKIHRKDKCYASRF
jgi:hypothetical protein